MERDAERLYELIWRQFVACQMPAAEYTATTITAAAGDYELNAKGRIIRFDGYTRVQPPAGRKAEDTVLPDVKEGDVLKLLKLDPAQHFTKPSPRYGEASLVRELEKRGIGRPSTYASIISTIQDRGYVRLENKRFYAEKMGDIVTQRWRKVLPNYWIMASPRPWKRTLTRSHRASWTGVNCWISSTLSSADCWRQRESRSRRACSPTSPRMTDIKCSYLRAPMQVRTASTGVFLGCSGYALPPKERCKNTINLTSGDEAIREDADDEAESRQLRDRAPLQNL